MNAACTASAPDFPVTIIPDHCGGWAALPFADHEVDFPDDWEDAESVCDFWADMLGEPVGRGATPNEALQDMQSKLDRCGGYELWAMPTKHTMESAWGR